MAELLSFVKNSKWRLSAILNYGVAMLDHPRSLYGNRKPVFKFHVDQFCSFEGTVNRRFCKFGLKRLFGPPKFTFLGVLTPKHQLSSWRPPKGTTLAENTSYEPSCVVIGPAVWPGRRAKNSQTKTRSQAAARIADRTASQ